MSINLLHGDCLEQMKTLEDNSVDAIVSDPPYGISFMSKKWDYDVPSVEVWKEAMRVLKPGGHALIACGTRTQHRMVVNIEDAGFEIRDVVSWIYGSGFPKSLNVSKAIDKMDAAEVQLARRYKFTEWVRSHGVKSSDIDAATGTNMGGHYTTQASQPAIMTREHLEACRHLFADVPQWVEDECDKRSVESENFKRREVVGTETRPSGRSFAEGASGFAKGEINITAPATDEAKQWDGWGTSLKPSVEFFTLCRKPLSEKTVAANVLKWGTGGINIDGCRVGTNGETPKGSGNPCKNAEKSAIQPGRSGGNGGNETPPQGRFPANLIHDGSQEVLDLFPETKSGKMKPTKTTASREIYGQNAKGGYTTQETIGDSGSAARFFYVPKASKKDRNEGCEELVEKSTCEHEGRTGQNNSASRPDGSERKPALSKNNHPTVKPTALMAYLCRLITPTGGVVLDPYMGSGSTGKAAVREGFSFVGIELDPDYYEIAKARVTAETQGELKSWL